MRKGGQNTLDPRFAEPRRALVRVCALADHEALTKLASTWGPQGSSVRGVYTAFTQQFPTEILHRVSLRGVHEAGPRGSEIPWTPPCLRSPGHPLLSGHGDMPVQISPSRRINDKPVPFAC